MDGKRRVHLTDAEIADLMACAPVIVEPWVRSISLYGRRLESAFGQVSRYG
jgi:hypothetical protein